jgi:xylan 1,4-beta-xylosidase
MKFRRFLARLLFVGSIIFLIVYFIRILKRILCKPVPEPRRATLVVSATPELKVPSAGPQGPVRADEFNLVGEFDIDWLVDPRFVRLLDNMAASPVAFKTVRVFRSLNSGGTLENTPPPSSSGAVWPSHTAPIDFSATFHALEALTSRGLLPFIVLGFFPAAVSPTPTDATHASLDNWKKLVRSFLDQLVADPRFGATAIGSWWFEVWNEPNFEEFWQGSFDQYKALYQATSEVVIASGYQIRLGGPALIYGLNAGASLMDDFLGFLSSEPQLKCDFISLHQKGDWSGSPTAVPDIQQVIAAVENTANDARVIDPNRFRGIPIVNNEADMRAVFNTFFLPRMEERFPAWLSSVMIAYDALSSQFSDAGFRFLAASDDANLQLVQACFDGTRSIMTRASASTVDDLFKVPVYNFYEVLRLLGDQHGTFISGSQNYFPNSNSDLFHAITVAATHLGSIFSDYPLGSNAGGSWTLNYSIIDIPWQAVNVARFQIDHTHSNAYTAAGGPSMSPFPFPNAATAHTIRWAQEFTVFAPIHRNVTLVNRTFHDSFTIDRFSVVVYWITPFIPDVPAKPGWIKAIVEAGNVILRWEPNLEPFFYSYEVWLMANSEPAELLSPVPLRAALWVDTAPSQGTRVYGVRAVSASNIASGMAVSSPVTV